VESLVDINPLLVQFALDQSAASAGPVAGSLLMSVGPDENIGDMKNCARHRPTSLRSGSHGFLEYLMVEAIACGFLQ
jgi:hypothetical protein